MKKAEWIWYPGDYELSVAVPLLYRRDYRKVRQAPFWRVDEQFKTVNYMRDVEAETEDLVLIKSCAELEIRTSLVPNMVLFPNENGEYLFPAGKYTVTICAYAKEGLPAIFVEGKYIVSDSKWVVSEDRYRGNFVPVGYNQKYDKNIYPDHELFSYREMYAKEIQSFQGNRVFDFGKEVFGYLNIKNIKGKGKIYVYYGESLEEALSKDCCETYDVFDVNGQTDYRSTINRAMRFVQIEAEAEFKTVTLDYEYLPLDYKGCFICNDEKVNKIFDVSMYTFHLNCRETFLDGIKRDRWFWGGDAYQSVLMNFYSFFDRDINRRTLFALRGKDPVRLHINHIVDYTFYWFISLYDHFFYTGDIYLLEKIFDRAKTLMDFCFGRIRAETGLLEGKKNDWVFIDWKPMDKRGATSAENILFWAAIDRFSKIASLLGKTEYSKELEEYNQNFKKLIFDVFYDKDKKLFCNNAIDGVALQNYTRYANIFAILYDFIGKEEAVLIQQAMEQNNLPEIVTPYAKFFELSALCKTGKTEEVLQQIKSYWGGMLDAGATTFWELYDPSDTDHYSMYGRPFGKSLCHAWGASPIYLLGAYFVGVQPTSPGYKTFSLTPNLEGFQKVKASIPVNDGSVLVEFENGCLRIENKSAQKGVLRLKGRYLEKPDYFEDGYQCWNIPAFDEISIRRMDNEQIRKSERLFNGMVEG